MMSVNVFPHRNICIFGCGKSGKLLYDSIRKLDTNIYCIFCDNNSNKYTDIPFEVVAPSEAVERVKSQEIDAIVIPGSYSSNSQIKIITQLSRIRADVDSIYIASEDFVLGNINFESDCLKKLDVCLVCELLGKSTHEMKISSPLYSNLEDFLRLCQQYKELYIYGDAETHWVLSKYLEICCGIIIKDFTQRETLKKVPINDCSAVILGLSENDYNEIYANLRRFGIQNIIFLTENAKKTIAQKMRVYGAKEMKIEVNLADHCNLNCRSCDHFSPIAEPKFADLAVFERDIGRIAELSEQQLGQLYLLGGEPFLNRDMPEFLRLARHFLPNTKLSLFTNGLLLLNLDFDKYWDVFREFDVIIKLTRYPLMLNFKAIEEKARLENVKLEFFGLRKHKMIKYTLNPNGDCPLFPVVECAQFNNCTVLRNGKVYLCPISANIGHFNAKFGQIFGTNEHNYIDIYTARNFQEIAEFLSHPVPFCRYCDIGARELHEWTRSNGTIDEWI